MHCSKTNKCSLAPNYYTKFKCIADKCHHSCCINWEIPIDDNTLAKYKKLDGIMSTVIPCDDGHCFALNKNGRCPHLTDCGLCSIILTHGEDYLSHICKSHPRFYNQISSTRTEIGLGIVCEEACRIILEENEPFSLIEAADPFADATSDTASSYNTPQEFDPLPQRDAIISAILKSDTDIEALLLKLKEEYNIPRLYSIAEWTDIFLSLETLEPEWQHTLAAAKSTSPSISATAAYNKYYERLLIYFVYRHVSISSSEENLRARLAFAMLSVEMIKHLFEKDTEPLHAPTLNQVPEKLVDYARRYSAEIEYSEYNTDELIFEFETNIF